MSDAEKVRLAQKVASAPKRSDRAMAADERGAEYGKFKYESVDEVLTDLVNDEITIQEISVLENVFAKRATRIIERLQMECEDEEELFVALQARSELLTGLPHSLATICDVWSTVRSGRRPRKPVGTPQV